MRNQIDKIIITAMDRFVWFVLLIVMSHLVTEFTRVTGYARGPRQDIVLVNDSLIQPRQVQSLLFLPGQDYGLYESASYNTNNNNNNIQANAPIIMANANAEPTGSAFNFSFRPLIDSIFEIPISTLRAVNNLVARLTGSYQQAPNTMIEKSAIIFDSRGFQATQDPSTTSKGLKKATLLREEIA